MRCQVWLFDGILQQVPLYTRVYMVNYMALTSPIEFGLYGYPWNITNFSFGHIFQGLFVGGDHHVHSFISVEHCWTTLPETKMSPSQPTLLSRWLSFFPRWDMFCSFPGRCNVHKKNIPANQRPLKTWVAWNCWVQITIKINPRFYLMAFGPPTIYQSHRWVMKKTLGCLGDILQMKYYSVMRGLWYTVTRFPITGVMTQTQAMPCYKRNPF